MPNLEVEVISLEEPRTRDVELCPSCKGTGQVWSDIGFGELPSDSRKITCRKCAGTGRLTKLRMVVDAIVPFDFMAPK
jgi:hypothetical protein